MTAAAVLTLVIAAIGLLVVVLALLTVGRRWSNRRAEERRLAVSEPLRPLLLTLVAGEPDETDAAATELVALDKARWRAVEPDLEAMLVKVRGETHESVVRVLERRGSLARALHRLTSRDPVTRARGAELLGACRREGAVDDLVEMLDDTDPEVRTVVARALGPDRFGARRRSSARHDRRTQRGAAAHRRHRAAADRRRRASRSRAGDVGPRTAATRDRRRDRRARRRGRRRRRPARPARARRRPRGADPGRTRARTDRDAARRRGPPGRHRRTTAPVRCARSPPGRSATSATRGPCRA